MLYKYCIIIIIIVIRKPLDTRPFPIHDTHTHLFTQLIHAYQCCHLANNGTSDSVMTVNFVRLVNVWIIYTIKTRRLSVVSVTVAAALAGDTDGLASWPVMVGVVDSHPGADAEW